MIPPMKPNPLLGVLLVLGAATLWGTTGTARTLADGSLSAYWFGALRLATASAFFAVCAAASRPPTGAPSLGRPATRHVLGAGLCMAVYNLAFFAGIGKIGVALGTAIALGSGPIWAGLLQALLHRQRPSAAWWMGTLVAVGGGVLMTLGGARQAAGVDAVGIVLCLLSGLSMPPTRCSTNAWRHAASASTITLGAFSVAAAVALPVAWWTEGTPTFTGADLAAVAYTGVITAGLPYLLFSHALRHIAPATGVTLALGEPVVAFALSVAVLGDRPTALAYLGLLLVVCGVLGVVRQELASQRPSTGSRTAVSPRRGPSGKTSRA